MQQQTLIEVDGPAPVAAAEPRQTSKGIAPGDIVLVDKRGRRFHAEVVSLDQGDSGRFELEVSPLERGITWRTASVREVIAVWRKVRRG